MLQFQGMIAEYERAQILERRGPASATAPNRRSLGSGWRDLWLPLHSEDERCAGAV